MPPLHSLTRVARTVVSALIISSFAELAMGAEMEWPQFRGPTGQGISAATNVPTQWSASENVGWKVAVPGQGWSSPVISNGKLYLTSAVAPAGQTDPTLHALCFDANDGRLLWDTEVFQPEPAKIAAMHRKNSPASATPIVTKDRIYVHFGHMGTAALDLEGKVLWRQDELPYNPVHGAGGSPTLFNDSLIFSADGGQEPFLASLDAATGQLRWKTPRNTTAKKQFSFSTPLVIEAAGTTQLISPASGFVGSYDPRDGRELWRVGYGEGYSVVPRPVFAHGLIFVSSGYDRAVLYAIEPGSAADAATAPKVAWTHSKGVPNTPSMLVVGDELYFVSDGGIATCADARTGKIHWTERLGGDFSASPLVAEGRIYFLNESGVSFVIKAGTKYELLAKNELGERALASPAAVDNALFLRTEGHLWKITK